MNKLNLTQREYGRLWHQAAREAFACNIYWCPLDSCTSNIEAQRYIWPTLFE
jgi:hypothetical protein